MSDALPLADAADERLSRLARLTGAATIAKLDGKTMLGERASLRGLRIPGLVSAGGFCRLYAAKGDWVALNLARPDDVTLLPALFEHDGVEDGDDDAIAAVFRACDATDIVARGREMGLAMAALHEPSPRLDRACEKLADGVPGWARSRPRVLDLSALWAGPLAAHLLWLAGAEVLKVESSTRPDAMRDGQPDFFALLNQSKASVVLDLRRGDDHDVLLDLIAGADIVIEAARPRALQQLGIDADRLVAAQPGLVWLTITGHGATGEEAGWVGFGDDCGIAGGLGAALWAATGRPGFVGDAIADPLTGLQAALTGWEAWQSSQGGRWGIAMRSVVARDLAWAQSRDPASLAEKLRRWAKDEGKPFPAIRPRPRAALPALGADPPYWRVAAPC